MLLSADDPAPSRLENGEAASDFVLVCDHAGRATPRALGTLGLPPAAFELHIAWDIGALALARRIAADLDAALVHQSYSRLVIDCNRPPDHPQAIVEASDGVEVPANRDLPRAERQARTEEIHAPYHRDIAAALDRVAALGRQPRLVCVHSFTPVMAGFARPWSVGLLHGACSPVSEAMISLLRRRGDIEVGDNQPYAMDGVDYTAPRHAWSRALDVLEIEVRQDLLASESGVAAMAARLSPAIERAWSAVPTAASCVEAAAQELQP